MANGMERAASCSVVANLIIERADHQMLTVTILRAKRLPLIGFQIPALGKSLTERLTLPAFLLLKLQY